MDIENMLARTMTATMEKAADELELRISQNGEEDPESRAIEDLADKMRTVQVLFLSLGVRPTAADLLEGVRMLFEREGVESLRPDVDGPPVAENVVIFQSAH